ncbi:MAG: cytochrome c oxidase subunit II [Mariniblastus sp.]|nr:cytochrome c oxidase subunit II [Mariniblastus sp.]
MNRFWSILFFLVPLLGTGTFLMAAWGMAPFQGAWLPENYSVAGKTIDHLFYLLCWISALIFIGTGIVIGWVLWRYDHRRQQRAHYFSHNFKLEMVWTIIPAIILVFIAFYQMNAWAETKMIRPTIMQNGQAVTKPPMVLVMAKRFGWEFHYAGPDGLIETADDDYIENELVLPIDTDIVLQLETRDVIHSFFVPQLRVKQDIVPGMKQFMWFRATSTAEMEIACTELCGWGHYTMQGRLRLVTPTDYQAWLAERRQRQTPPMNPEQEETGTDQAKPE